MDVEKLIYLIEAKPALYNGNIKEHQNKQITDKIWLEIAKEMNSTIIECRSKWTTLRNSYTRFLRDCKKPPGTVGKSRKKWYLADAMSFIEGYVNQNRPVSNVQHKIYITNPGAEICKIEPQDPYSDSNTAIDSPVPFKQFKTTENDLTNSTMLNILQTSSNHLENGNTLFFKSLMADFEMLSSKRQRTFKCKTLEIMNTLLNEDEADSFSTSISSATI